MIGHIGYRHRCKNLITGYMWFHHTIKIKIIL